MLSNKVSSDYQLFYLANGLDISTKLLAIHIPAIQVSLITSSLQNVHEVTLMRSIKHKQVTENARPSTTRLL